MTEDNLLDEPERLVTCPTCGADTPDYDTLMGYLGDLSYHRCPNCGAEWSDTEAEDM